MSVLVGESAEEYLFHRSIILQSSWFSKALEGDFEEARTGIIRLVDDDPADFTLYAHWLYTGRLLAESSNPDGKRQTLYSILIKAYIFGDKIDHNEYMDSVIDTIIHVSSREGKDGNTTSPSKLNVKLVYDNIARKDSPLKRLLVDHLVWEGHQGWFGNCELEDYHPEYLFDVALAMVQSRSSPSGIAPYDEADPVRYRANKVANESGIIHSTAS